MNVHLSLAALDGAKLTWPWPGRMITEFAPPGHAETVYDLALRMSANASEQKSLLRHTACLLERGVRPEVIWLDYGEQKLSDWGSIRRSWEEVCRMASAAKIQAGLRATALMLPESMPGHIAPRFVIEAVANLMPASRLWLGINLETRFLRRLLTPDPVTAVRPIGIFKNLGVRIAADLPSSPKL